MPVILGGSILRPKLQRLFDAKYTIDGLNRVTRALEGHLSAGSISGTTRDELWTLTQTGNWDVFKRDLDGDLNYNETNELNDDRTHDIVNQLTARDTDDNGTDNYTLTHDAAGQQTTDGKDYNYVWDAWGRLKEVKTLGNILVAEYKYNGLGMRTWARKLMPGAPDPRMNLALTVERAGRTDEALSTYASALEVDAAHIQALTRLQIRSGNSNGSTQENLREIAFRGTTPMCQVWARQQLSSPASD